MTIVSPMGQLRPIFADKNGKRLSGGKVYTYEPSTLILKTTYSDALGTIPNPNPINLDKSGEADIYLTGDYRMMVFDHRGVLIQDVNNFGTWASGIPATSIVYKGQTLQQHNEKIENEKADIVYVDTALTSLSTQAGKYYPTLTEANADIANIAVNFPVQIGEAANGGLWIKATAGATNLTKSAYDPLTQAKTYTETKTTDTFNNSAALSIDLVRGGNHYYAKAENLTFDGFITSEGVFTASSGGYKTSDFILVDISKPLVYSINASTTVSGISFWDANKAFISSINTNNDATQKTSAIPLNTKFIRVSNYATSNPNGYVYSAFENVLNQAQVAKEYSNILISGGNLIDVKPADFVFAGYITNTGSFTVSAAGYKTTDFIALDRLSTLTYSLNTSSVISSISYWDVNKNFIGYVTTNNVVTEAQSVPPENTKYIRATNSMGVTPNPYLKMTVSAITNDPTLVKSNDLTIAPSLNLADPVLIISDKYVNNTGTITSAAGWKYIKVPVKPNTSYAFGRFTVDTGGYYAFYDSNSVLIADTVSVVAGHIAQKVVSSPSNAAYFLLDIARPTNTSDQYSQLTINEGTSIIDYVAPTGTITKIKGFPLSGSDSGGGTPAPVPENVVVQGGSATLADVIADSVTTGALIANLPTSSTGLEVGQAYIDNGTVKVVMA